MNKSLKAPIDLQVIALIILLLTFVTRFGVGLSYIVQGGLRFIFTLTPQYWNYMCMSQAGSSNSSLILSTTRFLTRACSLLQGFSCELKVDVSQYFITLCLFVLEGCVCAGSIKRRGSEGILELILSVYHVSSETQNSGCQAWWQTFKATTFPEYMQCSRKKYPNLLYRKR